MSYRTLLTAAAIGSALAVSVAVPALPGSAAPSGGCPYPPNRPVLSLSAKPATVTAGKSETSFGKFTQNNCGIGHATVVLQRRALVSGKPSGKWSTFKTLTTDTNGVFSTTRAPARSEQQRALFASAGGFPATNSSTINVLVRTGISIAQTTPSGCRIHLTGKTNPAKGKRLIRIQNRGPKGHFNGWKTLWTATTTSKGAYSTVHTMACAKTFNLAVYIGGDSTNVANRSRTIFGIKTHH